MQPVRTSLSLDEKRLLKKSIYRLSGNAIVELGTWLSANPPVSDSDEDRAAFFAAVWTELDDLSGN